MKRSPRLTDVVEIAAGDAHTCARRGDQSVLCWGVNTDGQLGNGGTIDSGTPLRVEL